MRPRFHGVQRDILIRIAEDNNISPHTAIVAMSLMIKQLEEGIIPQRFIDEVHQHQPHKDKSIR